ncbi:hypothetical protein EUGRSUZ_E03922 [Eucalyptus grandis]|uniref:Uncharacterized protein n=2 Tax=Eucalyptus grandis TaxID=71139 RepID=A0ACC3L1K1_EUCGR|nr:hypothetical protein EUGRSUZ_E03922 [Eucalyptus grandis]
MQKYGQTTTSWLALYGLERRETPGVLPRLVPDEGLEALLVGPVLDLNDEPVVRPRHDLRLALHHLLQHQPRLGLVVARLDGELSDLPHVRVAQVLYRVPTPEQRLRADGPGGRDLEEEDGSDGEDEKSHFQRFFGFGPWFR